jgi:hypothetical protein
LEFRKHAKEIADPIFSGSQRGKHGTNTLLLDYRQSENAQLLISGAIAMFAPCPREGNAVSIRPCSRKATGGTAAMLVSGTAPLEPALHVTDRNRHHLRCRSRRLAGRGSESLAFTIEPDLRHRSTNKGESALFTSRSRRYIRRNFSILDLQDSLRRTKSWRFRYLSESID